MRVVYRSFAFSRTPSRSPYETTVAERTGGTTAAASGGLAETAAVVWREEDCANKAGPQAAKIRANDCTNLFMLLSPGREFPSPARIRGGQKLRGVARCRRGCSCKANILWGQREG